MPSVLLLNPKKRTRRAKSRKARSPAQRAAFRKMLAARRAANPIRKRARRAKASRRRRPLISAAINPIRRSRRRRNPIFKSHRRGRRRNPLGLKLGGSLVGMLKDAAIYGGGAFAFDWAWSQVQGNLPASMQTSANTVSAGDAVKAGVTIALGTLLDKPTRGMARKIATGALAMQFYEVISGLLPSTVTNGMAGMGWRQPASTVKSQFWNQPNRGVRQPGMAARLPAGHVSSSQALAARLPPGRGSTAQRVVGPRLQSVYSPQATGIGFGH
jgi:hypothetical protein